MNRTRSPLLHALALACLLLPQVVFAQYVWLDERGVKQYSDMPPPASVPARRIIKMAGKPIDNQPQADTPPPAKEEMTIAEKNAEFQKRRMEREASEKKAAQEERQAAEKSRQCDRAREFSRTLSSGERIARTDSKGERSFLTDEQRAAELRDARHILDTCK